MKYTLNILVWLTFGLTFAQSTLPDFLVGTWKMEHKEVYERWDKLNENSLKGFSYTWKDGQMYISEYLDISKVGNKIMYSATVLEQNSGKPVFFTLTKTDSTYVFENPKHDFPKKMVYQKRNDTEILVQVTDGKQKGFAFKMIKQFQKTANKDSEITNPNYDSNLAEKLGGDAYGMKSYFLVILKTGTNNTANKELISESFKGHMDNISRWVEEGKLVVAGPIAKNENLYRGIFILHNIKTIEDAMELLVTDPAINNGLLDYDIYTWYGSAALPEYLPFSDKIYKVKP
jgi:uncharacterized protein YciI